MEGSTRGNMTATSAASSLVGVPHSTLSSTKMEVDSKTTTEGSQEQHGGNAHEDLPGLVKSATDGSVSDESIEVDTEKVIGGIDCGDVTTTNANGSGTVQADDVPVTTSDIGNAVIADDGCRKAQPNDVTMAKSECTSKGEDSQGEEEEVDGTANRESLRESLRARLRAQEARLKGLVRNASADGVESVIGQMKTVQAKMHQVAAEKSALEQELERLRGATGDDEFLKDKLAGIQEGFDKQVRLIQSLQRQLDNRDLAEEKMRASMLARLSRLVELEYDLSTHELHFTNYAAEQFQLGEDALNEIKATKGGTGSDSLHESQSSLGGSASKSGTGRKAQKLISKLLYDLDALEARYKEDRMESITKIEALSSENDELKTQLEVLRMKLGEASDNLSENSDEGKDSFEAISAAQLRKHLEIAEARKNLFRKEVNHLRGELQEVRMGAEADERRAKLTVDALRDENEVLRSRVAKLETKKDGGGLLKKKKKDDANAASNSPEHMMALKIQANYLERCRLEAAVEIKDKQISTLKREVANLRLKDISEGNVSDSIYTEYDVALLRTAPNGSRSTLRPSVLKPGEGDDSAYVAELQRQLQEAQHQLVKKDQELVIERAKAASTAAGLLARITELTGKKVDGKSQKQVPLRFYL